MERLFYRGKGDPHLPPLILLHGLWGASENWLSVASFLTSRFHVILPDARNHGRSPHREGHDYETLAEDLQEWIGLLNLPERPFIAGHSMGGKALMVLLLKCPEIVSKAAILDIAPVIYPEHYFVFHCRLLDFIISNPLACFSSREEIHRYIGQYFEKEEDRQLLFKNVRKGLSGFEWKIDARTLKKHMTDLRGWPETCAGKRYFLPVLFVRGEQSDYIGEKETEQIRACFPQARIETLSGCGHRLHADRPEALAGVLMEFFQ